MQIAEHNVNFQCGVLGYDTFTFPSVRESVEILQANNYPFKWTVNVIIHVCFFLLFDVSYTNHQVGLMFPVPCIFVLKQGKKSTRFWKRCILFSKCTWAHKSTENRIRSHFPKIILYYYCKLPMCAFNAMSLKMQCAMVTNQNKATAMNAWISFQCSIVPTF